MAFYDNKHWMLTHIKDSYVTTDDTGMCELVMASDNISTQLKSKLNVFPTSDESDMEPDDFVNESYDIRYEGDFGMRYRSNTAAYLEKLGHEKKKAIKMKLLKWESLRDIEGGANYNDMFIAKEVDKTPLFKKSLLTFNLEKCSHLPSNPYIDYSKFDGSAHVSIPVRKYKIFITMLPDAERNYPMNVCCLASAKVHDLIGLILLKCSTIYGDVKFKSVDSYGLYITEDDGEVDTDFPCLNPKECVAKFGFTCLGLVEHDHTVEDSGLEQLKHVSVIMPASTNQEINKHSNSLLIRMNEARQMISDLQLLDGHNRAMVAPLYKSYCVNIINKMKTKIEVNLGISSDKFEIDPIQQKSLKLVPFKKLKPVSQHMDFIAWCEMSDTKSSRPSFRVFYSTVNNNSDKAENSLNASHVMSVNFRHYDFEADRVVAEEIVHKINHILEIRSSLSRKEFIAARDKKYHKKKTHI